MVKEENQSVPHEAEIETPAEFLMTLSKALRGRKDIDVELVDILSAHLLVASPAERAVVQAKDAILKLADVRAKTQSAEVAGD